MNRLAGGGLRIKTAFDGNDMILIRVLDADEQGCFLFIYDSGARSRTPESYTSSVIDQDF